MDMFNLMGDIFGGAFDMPTPEKKETKKEKKETKKKTSTKKKEKVSKVELPCTVFGGSFKTVVTGDGLTTEMDTNKLAEILMEMGFAEVANSARAIFVAEDVKNVAYIVSTQTFATEKDIAADFSAGEIVFAYGEEKMAMKAEDFTGKEEDEICVADLVDKIVEFFPHHKGKFSYDVTSSSIVPVMDPAIKGSVTVTLPASFVVNGEEMVLDEETVGGTKAEDIISYLTGAFAHKDVTFALIDRGGKYHLSMSSYKADKTSVGKKNAGAESKKVEKKYPSDVTAYLIYNGHREQLSAEKFGGKEKITLQDIIEYWKPKFAILRSEEKSSKVSVYNYDEEGKYLSITVGEGTRGACSPF